MSRDLSVNYISVQVIMYMKIGCFLVRGASLPAAQLFVIVIENILRGGYGQFNENDNGGCQLPLPAARCPLPAAVIPRRIVASVLPVVRVCCNATGVEDLGSKPPSVTWLGRPQEGAGL